MARTRPHPKRYERKLAARKPCVHGEPGLDLRPHQIVLRPLVTEKGTHAVSKRNAYTFMVHMLADKNQIAAAVKELFNVRVEAVRTQVRKGKQVRFKNRQGQQSDWKRAIVTLNTEDKIDFF
jgi:large subunit ribosomal protein L23